MSGGTSDPGETTAFPERTRGEALTRTELADRETISQSSVATSPNESPGLGLLERARRVHPFRALLLCVSLVPLVAATVAADVIWRHGSDGQDRSSRAVNVRDVRPCLN